MKPRPLSLILALGLCAATPLAAAQEPTLPDSWTQHLNWRSVGPANMGGRITSIAVNPTDHNTYYIGTATGGLLKTSNLGTTYEYLFQHEAVSSIGDVEVSASNPEIVWVGTGEENPRNSVSWGNGVYKSTDGGKNWQHMGLDAAFQIGAIEIHPTNPDIVYVGVLGRLWGPSEDRGLYKTTDGGKNWEKVLYVDEFTGVIEVQMSPADPETLLVASYERERDGFDTNDPAKKWGKGSGIWKTTDGGKNWQPIRAGLPSGILGRIGIDYYQKDPQVVFAVVESERITQEPEDAAWMGVNGEDAEVGARLTSVDDKGPGAEAGLESGDIVLAVEGQDVLSWKDLNDRIRSNLAGTTVHMKVVRDRKTRDVEVTFQRKPSEKEDHGDEGEGEQKDEDAPPPPGPFHLGLGGQVANIQDQQGPDGHEYGGVYRSDDGGDTWTRINSVNPRPMYYSHVYVDPQDDQRLYVLGTQLHRSSDGGKTFTADGHDDSVHVDHHAMWIDPSDGRHMILGNDGGLYVTWDRMEHWDHHNHVAIGQFYQITADTTRDYKIYGGLQDNGSWGGPQRSARNPGPVNGEWFNIGGGDGFKTQVDREDPNTVYGESQNGWTYRVNLATGDFGSIRARPPRGERFRFNWNTPFILSAHNSRIYYSAGNKVFRSLDRGRDLRVISPDITRTDRGAATALAESPRNPDKLYVGSDDGAMWRTLDGGHTWEDLFALPAPKAEAKADQEKQEAETLAAPDSAAERPAPPAEGRGGPGGGRRGNFAARLMESDANGDGKLVKDELPERMAQMFDRFDENGDGAITKDELEAMQGRFGGGRGGGDRPARPQPPANREASDVGAETTPLPSQQEPAPEAKADPVTGLWKATAVHEQIPEGQGEFTIDLKLGEEGKLSGTLSTDFGDGPISKGRYDAETGKLSFSFESDAMAMNVSGTLTEGKLNGEIDAGPGMMVIPYHAEREGGAPAASSAPTGGERSARGPQGRRGPSGRGPGQGQGQGEDPDRAGHDWAALGDLLPDRFHVSSIVASQHDENRVYATFDGHRSNNDLPWVMLSEDNGSTWRSLRSNLPDSAGSARVIAEDIRNPQLLFLGCEFGAWASIDRGASWTRINNNLPTVPIHDFFIHPLSGEIIAGTHGRSAWILDITPLRQMNAEVVKERVKLYQPNDVVLWGRSVQAGDSGTRRFVGQNPDRNAHIHYSLADRVGNLALWVTDLRGEKVADLEAASSKGLNMVNWDLRRHTDEENSGNNRRRRFARPVPAGTYIVHLQADNTTLTSEFEVLADPTLPASNRFGVEEERERILAGPDDEDEFNR